MPSLYSKIKNLPKALENHSLDFPWKSHFTQFRKFVSVCFLKECLRKKNSRSFWFSFLEFTISVIFCISNAFYDVQIDIQTNKNVTNSYI